MVDIFFQFIKFLYHACGGNFGLAIIVLGVFTRLIFFPFTRQQLKTSKKMNELAPEIAKLKKKYEKDQKKFQEEQLKLFQAHGVNPMAGCLPMILQIVIFSMLYQAFYKFLGDKTFNMNFLIWTLNKPDAYKIMFDAKNSFMFPGVLVFLSSATQFLYSKMMMPKPVPVNRDDKPKEVEQKTGLMDQMAEAQSQMIYIFPIMFLFLGTSWPSGLALYWTISTTFAIIEHILVNRKTDKTVSK